ncbi:Hypothetical protein R9X50_00476100 [Acrodontium crateriforme]|uniref:Major facilitator superfamily (MFS) profile domain-containing protein n=1 Tax=Acrodontium crateriforme TaxID=150365 RepID=A0AAQ3MBI5_9PEZI|nr:Hypothetical protein R9X50_00476100 [Acrodontium crateriforme]
MAIFGKTKDSSEASTPKTDMSVRGGSQVEDHAGNVEKRGVDNSKARLATPRVFAMALIVSIGGLIFGYDTGQISGFLEMKDFQQRFGNIRTYNSSTGEYDYGFTDVRSGTIVALLSIGTLIGALASAPIADVFGRRICIVVWNIVFCLGVVIQIATQNAWYQIVIGRFVAGLGVGGLSVLTPMYQSETAPRQIRGTLVSTYQLFITFGILIAYLINYGTHTGFPNAKSAWQIPMGIGFIWPVIMGIGICFLRESPRWDYRHGNIDAARLTIAKSYGVPINNIEVEHEINEIRAKLEAENAGGGKHKFYEVFTGPRMLYRVTLGVALQALQQLTGANYFFYYGTSIFASIGLSDSFITSIILGGVNFAMTLPGLWVVENLGRRRALISGALWMFMCFLVFASVGHFILNQETPDQTQLAGRVMIAFACLFIAGYAMTWGPIVWAVVGEMFPSRYRAQAMGISSASNWIWNFLLSFFTPFITKAIDYRYGYVFAGCCFAGAAVVYFFLCEHRGRSLEEIDTMYITHVPPRQSTLWIAPEGEDLVTTDALHLTPGARGIRKADAAGVETDQRVESAQPATSEVGIQDVSGTAFRAETTGVRGNSVSK